jgi:hypothetical protein
MARFGLSEQDIYQGTNKTVLGYLFDQYVRACGFTPTESWVFIVRPDGRCEFTPLKPGDPFWCCEHEERLGDEVGSVRPTGPPPWETERTWSCPPPRELALQQEAVQGELHEKRRHEYCVGEPDACTSTTAQ